MSAGGTERRSGIGSTGAWVFLITIAVLLAAGTAVAWLLFFGQPAAGDDGPFVRLMMHVDNGDGTPSERHLQVYVEGRTVEYRAVWLDESGELDLQRSGLSVDGVRWRALTERELERLAATPSGVAPPELLDLPRR